jgi:hypothetical protein
VGDLVWRRSYATTDRTKHFSAKLAKQFIGPFTITEQIGKNVYALVDEHSTFKGRWHVKDLKPDRTREADSDPESASQESPDRENGLGDNRKISAVDFTARGRRRFRVPGHVNKNFAPLNFYCFRGDRVLH